MSSLAFQGVLGVQQYVVTGKHTAGYLCTLPPTS